MHGKRDGSCSQAFQGLRGFWNYLTVKLPSGLTATATTWNRKDRMKEPFIETPLPPMAMQWMRKEDG